MVNVIPKENTPYTVVRIFYNLPKDTIIEAEVDHFETSREANAHVDRFLENEKIEADQSGNTICDWSIRIYHHAYKQWTTVDYHNGVVVTVTYPFAIIIRSID